MQKWKKKAGQCRQVVSKRGLPSLKRRKGRNRWHKKCNKIGKRMKKKMISFISIIIINTTILIIASSIILIIIISWQGKPCKLSNNSERCVPSLKWIYTCLVKRQRVFFMLWDFGLGICKYSENLENSISVKLVSRSSGTLNLSVQSQIQFGCFEQMSSFKHFRAHFNSVDVNL